MSSSENLSGRIVGQYYQVGKKIGEGTFSVVFEGVNLLNHQTVAIKFEPRGSHAPQLRNEWRSYGMLAGSPGIPQAYYLGTEDLHNVLVIDRLGPNLEELFKMCGRRFSLKTVCLIAHQMITRVQTIHEKDLIYRGINPCDFLTGLLGSHTTNVIHMVDFGMSKRWRDPKTKQHIPYREGKLLVGFARYTSINTHLGQEQSRRDDLEGLGYVIMHFLRGGLPWMGLKTAIKKEWYEMVGVKKQETSVAELCAGFPEETAIYMNYVRNLGFDETPDYDFLRGLFHKMLRNAGEADDGVMDWMLLNGGKGLRARPYSTGTQGGRAHFNHHNLAPAQLRLQRATTNPLQPQAARAIPRCPSTSSLSSGWSIIQDPQIHFNLGEIKANSPPKPLQGIEGIFKEDNAKPVIRDRDYYFEDGSVTLRVGHILFRVHASLLKAHSEDFFNKLNQPLRFNEYTAPNNSPGNSEITIPNIQPSQFRNLMKIIYPLPSSNVIFTHPVRKDNKAIVGDFDCYLDVVILSRRFAMETIQQWAMKKLSDLAHESIKVLVEELGDFYERIMPEGDNHIGDDTLSSHDDAGDVPTPVSYPAFRFIEAIRHAKAVGDNTLFYDMLSGLEYYCVNPNHKTEFLVSFFRIAELRNTDPPLFGFLFLLLLYRGNQVWMESLFTREDRMAFFSAQSFLTPLPPTLKESIVTPLFTRPACVNDFITILPKDTSCEVICSEKICLYWAKVFTIDYYDDINNKEFSVSIKALITLPLRRLNFATGLGEVKCEQCTRHVLKQLDQDMQEVFARLAEYCNAY